MSTYIPVKNCSDRTPVAKLATKDDIDVLHVVAEAKEYPERERLLIEKMEREIQEEQASKYPDNDYIARRQKKIIEIRKNITLYNMQRGK